MVACLVLANKGHSHSTFTRTKHQLKSTQPVVMTSRNEPFSVSESQSVVPLCNNFRNQIRAGGIRVTRPL